MKNKDKINAPSQTGKSRKLSPYPGQQAKGPSNPNFQLSNKKATHRNLAVISKEAAAASLPHSTTNHSLQLQSSNPKPFYGDFIRDSAHVLNIPSEQSANCSKTENKIDTVTRNAV